MQEKNTFLFVTRAQPCHNGHLSVLHQAVEAGAQEIIIAIGSADKERTQENPFTYDERSTLVQAMINTLHQTYPDVNVNYYPVMDFGDNTQWRNYIEAELPSFDTIVTWNPIVKSVWSDKDIFEPSKVNIPYRGTHIRHQIGQQDRQTLGQSVSHDVLDALHMIDADAIVQEINKLQPATIRLASDLIVMHEWKYVLITRKYAPYGLALPGGMMDDGETMTQCAVREWLEELFDPHDTQKSLRLTTDQPLRMLDDPTRDPRGRVISFVYEAEVLGGTLVGSDDAEEELTYVSPDELDTIDPSQFAFHDHYETLVLHRYNTL